MKEFLAELLMTKLMTLLQRILNSLLFANDLNPFHLSGFFHSSLFTDYPSAFPCFDTNLSHSGVGSLASPRVKVRSLLPARLRPNRTPKPPAPTGT